MILTVRCQTYQARLRSLLFDTGTEITGYIPWHKVAVNLVIWLLQFLQLVHHVCQHGVSVQNRPGGECLCTLGTAENPQMIFLLPVIINAEHAVAVATWNGDWIFQQIQAD